jgi:hypothetical protein
MHTTLEAIIEANGQISTLEPIVLPYPSRALVTILEGEPRGLDQQQSMLSADADPIRRFCGSGRGGATARLLAERQDEREREN